MRRNNPLCANHLELSQFMNPTLKNKMIHCAVPTLFGVPNKPKKITLSRPPPKKRSIHVLSTSAYVKISPTDYGEPSLPSKKTPTTKLSQLSPKKQFLSTRLYRGWTSRLMSDNFTCCHTRDRAGRP